MNISAKTAFIILAVVVFIGEFSKDPENAPGRPIIVKKDPSYPPLAAIKPEGVGKIGPGSGGDAELVIEEEPRMRRAQYSGTAFSIDDRGLWVTARHVTHNCDRLMLARPFKRPLAVKALVEHDQADVSIIQTDGGYAALGVDVSAPDYNQDGFHFGFPRGQPGEVYSKLIGRRTMKTVGAESYKETVYVWAEKIRVPDSDETLGGISGGPILNKTGKVVGIHVAGSVRRGRSFSSLPNHINELLIKNRVSLPGEEYPVDISKLNPGDFSTVGSELRDSLTVAQVICRVD
ncbi:MAG: trypsin-like peptidase domain-containing protein [Alphaproteobacteria bacterium]|nr:trypsin-like peptidase domain-containing protein [Alphaproteobacteria bacterium]HPF45329.1 serine protease [Emcibacteraceae bacterium]HRW30860.1 serine protease [Emcibacteraceae bacterium]